MLYATQSRAAQHGTLKPLFAFAPGFSVSALFSSLFLNQVPKLTLHYFEGVVDNLGQRLMRSIVHLFFFGDEFVTRRDGYIDANSKFIALFVGVIGLLDGDVAPADVIAKLVQPRGFLSHHLLDAICFGEPAIGNVHWQLHSVNLRAVPVVRQG